MSRRVPRAVLALLWLYPSSLRRAHGEEINSFLQDEAAGLSGGRLARGGFWLATALDLLRGAWRARRSPGTRSTRRRPPRSAGSLVSEAVGSLRLGARTLAKTPLVTAVIVVTLALGVGLNTAIFSVVHTVLLQPFPYEDPERLYYVGSRWSEAGVERASHTGADLELLRRESHAFADVAGVTSIRQNLTDTELPRQVRVGWASANLFSVLGVEPLLGPGFEEESPPGTLVLSYELWRDRYGSDPAVVGTSVRLDEMPYTVAGVLPRGFELYLPDFPARVDVWKNPDDWWQNGDLWDAASTEFALLDLIGRLEDGATVEQAQAEMDALARDLRAQRIDYERVGVEYRVTPLGERAVAEVRGALWVLFGAVGLVLLIACANVMNLMLARAFARSREIGLRLALGASRSRIVATLLGESLLLAVLGGAAGVLVSIGATQALQALRPDNVPRLDQVAVDGNVLGFALVAALLSVVLFGLVPAVDTVRGVAGRALSARSTSGRRRGRLRQGLVVAQLSLSLVLLIGAALLTRSMQRLTEVRPGFDADHLLTFSLSLPGAKYERPEGTDRFFRELEERIEALPGVERVGVIWPLPLSGRNWSSTYSGGAVAEANRSYAQYRLATPDLFEALDVPLVAGRSFAPGDPRHVVVVSAQLAAQAWPDGSALGRTLHADPWGGGPEAFEVIGVVGDVLYSDLRGPAAATMYFDSRGWSWTDWEVDYVVRSETALSELVEPIRAEILALDPAVPMARPRTMEAYVDDHLAANRFALGLIGLFAVVAGVLAAVGLYGVLSYAVSQRRREIGVRMAIGASRSRILSWVMREALGIIAVGISLGVGAALLVTRFLSAFLYGVGATDPLTFVAMALLFALVGVLAATLPAHRATRVEPTRVLRAE